MRITKIIAAGLLLSAVAAHGAAAQWNLARTDAGRNRVYTTVGLDPALVSSVGYARLVPMLGRDVQFSADIGLVTARLDTHDFRARLGVQYSVVNWKSIRLTGSSAFITRGTENSIYRGLNFGSDFTGTAGVYRPSWFAATQFGYDKAVITHITHSDWYRTYFYPDAKDGWYLDAGGTYHYGVTGGFALGRAELVGRFGFQRTQHFNDLIPPMYGSVGVGFAF